MNELNDQLLAVLIDADNISSKSIKNMLTEISRYGTPTIKRIYGDWTKPDLIGWKNSLLEHAITPMQQYSYTSGKNSTDSAMIIDAMDILYTAKVDGFCIVSSDSDFTRLAIRLREAGKMVYGIGERKTPISFIAACSKFIYVEILGQTEIDNPDAIKETEVVEASEIAKDKDSEAKTGPVIAKPDKMIREDLKNLISSSVSALADEDGWAYLAAVGALINKKQPEFDSRNYGFQKLTSLLRSLNAFELDERTSGTSRSKQIYVKNHNKLVKPNIRRKKSVKST